MTEKTEKTVIIKALPKEDKAIIIKAPQDIASINQEIPGNQVNDFLNKLREKKVSFSFKA